MEERRRRTGGAAAALAVALLAGACSPTVRVEAPDEPIEINVNVRIEQDVRIRIDRELEEVIGDNEDIFGIPAAPIP
ncbi:MAG: YnbE family lipoprotein [Rhodospirillaceae bacterium]|nr:YnbE family lipoprotein [Rhodospirillaceae bacterium]MCA8931878.1 YnbE family lipoprotein [Rhodospirillaceae bacterium]